MPRNVSNWKLAFDQNRQRRPPAATTKDAKIEGVSNGAEVDGIRVLPKSADDCSFQAVREFQLPGGGKGWKTDRSSLSIWQPGGGILFFSIEGYGAQELAAPCIKALDQVVAAHRPARVFNDFGKMEGYDSQLRTQLTARTKDNPADVSGIHVLVQSPLVAMGVAVANLALGGLVRTYSRRNEFHAELDATLKQAGIVNFSSRVLLAVSDIGR